MNSALENYRQLRGDIDRISQAVAQAHGDHITCQEGCCECCVNLTVFPVEFFAILEELKAAGVTQLEFDRAAACGYLREGRCIIYPGRPLICRTHGIPVVYEDDQADEPAYQVSFCHLNFTGVELETLAFGPDNTLNIDDLNMRLYHINLDFIKAAGDGDLTPSTRMPLEQLGQYL